MGRNRLGNVLLRHGFNLTKATSTSTRSRHRQPLASPVVDTVYAISSVCFVGAAVVAMLSRSTIMTGPQRQGLWFWGISVHPPRFSGLLLSIARPSVFHFRSADARRIDSLLRIFLYGLDCVLGRMKNNWAKPLALAGLILFLLISEIAINRMMFSNTYNWFHM